LSYTINNSGKTSKETSEYLNKGSYRAFEALMFAGLQSFLNTWRWKTLRLNKLYGGSGISNAIPRSRIPMSYMWSPSFVPKPNDWPEQCRVVGTFILNENRHSNVEEDKFSDLIQWIEGGDKPVFVGFGSMCFVMFPFS
jgi:sterol 3beta-glucosyltransferase